MRTRGGTEDVPLTEEAQQMLGPRWADAAVFIPRPADEDERFTREALVTYWALDDDTLL